MSSSTVRETAPTSTDLASYHRVGLVSFVCVERDGLDRLATGGLDELATQRFCDELLHSGLGLDVVELGALSRVLHMIGRTRLDDDAVGRIAERWHVAALLLGQLTCTSPREPIHPRYGHERPTVAVSLSVRVLDTTRRKFLWSRSLRREEPLRRAEGATPYTSRDDTPEILTGELLHELCAELGRARLASGLAQ